MPRFIFYWWVILCFACYSETFHNNSCNFCFPSRYLESVTEFAFYHFTPGFSNSYTKHHCHSWQCSGLCGTCSLRERLCVITRIQQDSPLAKCLWLTSQGELHVIKIQALQNDQSKPAFSVHYFEFSSMFSSWQEGMCMLFHWHSVVV